jgi:hypothetical protein
MSKKQACSFTTQQKTLPEKPTGLMEPRHPRNGMALRLDRSYVCSVNQDHLIMGSQELICCINCNFYWSREDANK